MKVTPEVRVQGLQIVSLVCNTTPWAGIQNNSMPECTPQLLVHEVRTGHGIGHNAVADLEYSGLYTA
jgi:hypothetical protein